jgi:hypothetical protein
MKRILPALFGAATLLVATVACTPRDVSASTCLASSRPQHLITPTTHPAYAPSARTVLANGTTLDARGAGFDDTTLNTEGYGVGVKLYTETGSRDNLCFVGGSVYSSANAVSTPWTTWHKVTGFTVLTPNIQIIGTQFFNQGDAISIASPDAGNWKLIGVGTAGGPDFAGGFIHDDCVENDAMTSGLVTDSRFDGCQVFMSSIGSSANGSANKVEVANTLVRLQSMYNSFDPTKYGFNQHGGFFKWASGTSTAPASNGVPPQLYIHDSTFRADSPAHYGGNVNGFLGLPPNTKCDNVTLINTASWPKSDLASWQRQCTHITYGTTNDWNAKVNAWNAAHPLFAAPA